jgi:hypothetical protein
VDDDEVALQRALESMSEEHGRHPGSPMQEEKDRLRAVTASKEHPLVDSGNPHALERGDASRSVNTGCPAPQDSEVENHGSDAAQDHQPDSEEDGPEQPFHASTEGISLIGGRLTGGASAANEEPKAMSESAARAC